MRRSGLFLLFLQMVPYTGTQGGPEPARAHSSPTFLSDIAPILLKNCAPCHRPGGGGPFPLLSFEDVRKHASQIADVTRRRYMPPWLPDAPEGAFLDERRLSQTEIRAIAEWVEAKCPRGQTSDELPHVETGESTGGTWQLGPPDMVLSAAHPLRLDAGGQDVFWNFVYQTPLDTQRYVRAIEIHPGKDRLVHHANLIVDRTGATMQMEKDPGSGFPGMDLDLGRSPLDPESHFLFWKPGSVPYAEAEGFSWQLNPGNVLVLNAHLQPSGKPEEVNPTIGLYFTDQAPTRFPILTELEADQMLNIPAGRRDFVVEDRLTLPEDVYVLAIYPHAHYLGTLLEGTATLPDGKSQTLIRIPHWDLNQQSVYRYRTPQLLPKGTVVSMRFHYDNSPANVRNPNHPAMRVRAGNRAADEMAHLWLQLLPVGPGDRRRPIQEMLIRHRIQQTPLNAVWHRNLAALLLSRLDAQGAISELRTAIQLDSTRPEAYDMLGAALQNTGQVQGAIEQYKRAIQVAPNYWSAHYNLAMAILKTGAWQEAEKELEIVAKAYPANARLQQQVQELRSRAARAAGHP